MAEANWHHTVLLVGDPNVWDTMPEAERDQAVALAKAALHAKARHAGATPVGEAQVETGPVGVTVRLNGTWTP